jgi:uncharacterized protein
LKKPLAVPPVLESPTGATFNFGGLVGERIEANQKNWLLPAPDANPAMLQIFRDRDRLPHRDLVPWAGEFAGKYLISGVQVLRITKNRALRSRLQAFVAELVSTQRPDGYLGPFPSSEGMIGPGRWDLWGQYHVMLGLFDWYKETGDRNAFAACRRCADHFCKTFLSSGKRVLQAGSEEMNESSAHIFALLYEETGEARYLQLVREIEKDWETPPSGDYVRAALAGKPFYQTPKPRWESLHSIQAIAELYFITGEEKYKKAFEQTWWSIVEGDRHNTGGFSSGEQATGNPYDPRPIETCCTVAWMAITRDYLRMTGDSRAADELELSTWNATLGAQHPSGRWWTYNTPMDGDRKASAHEIVFQARAGSPELNCCSVNGPRGLGMLSEWAVMTASDGLALNWYGPSDLTLTLTSGRKARIAQDTDFPSSGTVRITISPERTERFNLRLRIPGWSKDTTVRVQGKRIDNVTAGSYLSLDREWQSGDRVEIQLDMRPRIWVGEREAQGKVSVYTGPVLLAYDPRFDTYAPNQLPALGSLIQTRQAAPTGLPEKLASVAAPYMRLRFNTAEGKGITLCDFASAGAGGNPYVSWLPAPGYKPAPFSRVNPLRVIYP